MEPPTSKSLVKVLDREENFNFRPYSYTPQGMFASSTFEETKEKLTLIPQEGCSGQLLILLARVASTLLFCKLETKENITAHNPQQAFRQSGYDQ